MRYWKGKKDTVKGKQYGTMADDGFVPDSTEGNKVDYDKYVPKTRWDKIDVGDD